MSTWLRLVFTSIVGLALLAACGTPQPPTVDHELTVALAGDGSGRVTSIPTGINTADDQFTATFPSGTLVTLTAVADEGSGFAGFTFPDDPDRTCDAGSVINSCIFTLDESLTVAATFTEAVDETENLSVTVAGDGSGRVTSEPGGIDVTTGTSTAAFPTGAPVTLTATPAFGSDFTGFTFPDDAERACEEGSTDTTCVVTLNEDVDVTATFSGDTTGPDTDLSVTVNAGAGSAGTVVSSPAGIDTAAGADVATFAPGTEVTLTAEATEGFFAGWTGDVVCDGQTADIWANPTCTFTMGDAASVTANFNASTTVTYQVAALSDNAEEFLADSFNSGNNNDRWPEGHTYLFSDDLELGYDPSHGPQAVGVRFAGVEVPAGANVLNATIGFTAFANPTTGSTTDLPLTITGHAVQDSEPFVADTNFNPGPNEPGFGVTGRARTSAVDWTITGTWTADQTYQSSDVASILREVIALDGWSTGNAVSFIIEPVNEASTVFRRAYAFTGSAANAPVLTIEYVPLPSEAAPE
jgi:hypothetical protein